MCLSSKRIAHRDLELWNDLESWMWLAQRYIWAGRWEIQNSHPVEGDSLPARLCVTSGCSMSSYIPNIFGVCF